MAAGDTDLTCPLHFQRNGFHLLSTVGIPVLYHGLEDAVVAPESCLILSSDGAGAVLATNGAVTGINFLGIVVSDTGSATGSANDTTKVPYFQITDNDLIWAKVGAGTIATDSVGSIFDVNDHLGIKETDETIPALGVAFLCLATDVTNNYALGKFLRGMVT